MYLTGFADEAADSITGQIEATKQLGWRHIECRTIDGVSLHDMEESAFERACEALVEAGGDGELRGLHHRQLVEKRSGGF